MACLGVVWVWGSAMADVFISYSKADRPLALKLAAMLEAEGWKVWWDTGLIPGDDFRNEIMSQLGRARAVIVIWTDASIKSDWVRSEAGRAQAGRKLIPVKLPNLSYKDLPPPFDVLYRCWRAQQSVPPGVNISRSPGLHFE